MRTEASRTVGLATLTLATLLLSSGCSSETDGHRAWAEPADPLFPTSEHVPDWPVTGDRLVVDQVRGQPGPVLAEEEHLVVPTGYGLRRLRRDGGGEGAQVATPGWATEVVRVGDRYWVADGPSGVAVLQLAEDSLTWVGSSRVGTVSSLESVGAHVLATLREGALLTLTAGDDGMPVEVDRLVLDGTPLSVTARPQGAGFEWLATLSEAGLARGAVDNRGRLERRHIARVRRWPIHAEFFGAGLLAGGSEPQAWGSGLRAGEVELGLPLSGLAVAADGSAWLAVGTRGVARIGDADQEEAGWIRSRPGHAARFVATSPVGDELFVSWSDGVVEQLALDGALVEAHVVGREGLVHRVAGEFVAHYLARDRGRVVRRDGGASFDLPSEIYDLEVDGEGVLIAAEASGVARIRRAGSEWALEDLRRCVADAVVRGPGGSIWIADEVEGLVRVRPDGSVDRFPAWSGAEAVTVAVDERRAVTTTFFASDLLAVDLAGGPSVRAIVPGRPTGLVLAGDRAVVSMPYFGLAVVPLDAGDWPEAELLELPWPNRMGQAFTRMCAASPERVLVMMGEAGVAVVRVAAGEPPSLERIVETPGRAIDCAAGADGAWLIADHAALLELTLAE
jgi:hypothetical protein